MSDHSSERNSKGTFESMHRARGYQLEMLEQSLARNIIVAVLPPPRTFALYLRPWQNF